MSYSWVDPHFAALYARREEERLAERLSSCLRRRALCEPDLGLGEVARRDPTWLDHEIAARDNLRLL